MNDYPERAEADFTIYPTKKHVLDLTKEELETMGDEEFNAIAWQSNVTPPITSGKIAKVRALARKSIDDII